MNEEQKKRLQKLAAEGELIERPVLDALSDEQGDLEEACRKRPQEDQLINEAVELIKKRLNKEDS